MDAIYNGSSTTMFSNSTTTTTWRPSVLFSSPPPPSRTDYCKLPRNMFNNISFASLILFIPITVFGNLLVIAVIFSSTRLKKQTTFLFLASLAIADTLVGLVSMPFNARMQWRGGFLCLGESLCWIYTLEEIFLSITSVIHLFVIGVDRYLSLRYVYQYNTIVTRRRVFAIICAIWGFSAFVASLVIFSWKDPSKIAIITKPAFLCAADNTLFFTCVYIICFIIPLIIMIYTYSYVYSTASRHIKEISRVEVGSDGMSDKKSRDKKRRKRQFRTLRSIVIVFMVYCICWYPTIFYILSIFHAKSFWKKQRTKEWFKVMHFLLINFLPPLNSTTNPFIYVLCNKQFRKVCKQFYYKLTNHNGKSLTYMATMLTEDNFKNTRVTSPCSKKQMKSKAVARTEENSEML